MLVFIPAETRAGERRVGLTPEGAQKLIKLGLTVSIQEGAGKASGYHDDEYKAVGATTAAGASGLSSADVVATVRPLENDAISQLKSGAITISFL
jgi:NAD(P) transhydrogenase subunit alpha